MIYQLFYDEEGCERCFQSEQYQRFDLRTADWIHGDYPCLCEWSAIRACGIWKAALAQWIGFTSYRQDDKEPGKGFRFDPEMVKEFDSADVLTWGLVACHHEGQPCSAALQLDDAFPGLTDKLENLLNGLPEQWYDPAEPVIMCNYWAMRKDNFLAFTTWAEPIFQSLMASPDFRGEIPRQKGHPITEYGAVLERLVNIWIWKHDKTVKNMVGQTIQRKPVVMLALPGGPFCQGVIEAVVSPGTRCRIGTDFNSNGWDDFDYLWARALTRAAADELDYFVMLHSDVWPEAGWIDTLVSECERLGADMISAVVPLKDPRGLTSTAISRPEDRWGSFRRLSVKELPMLPPTFNAADCGYEGYVLLHNTGCWIADLRKPIFRTMEGEQLALDFSFPRRIVRDPSGYRVERESEDWHFSRVLHRLGAKTFATSAVRLRHMDGKVPHPNYGSWGSQAHDEDMRAVWEQGPFTHLDIHGWFDFAGLYDAMVSRVNGKPAHFVEVGSWLGKSAAFMADRIRRSKKEIRFEAIDNWAGGSNTPANSGPGTKAATRDAVTASGRDLLRTWETNIRSCGVAEFVKPIRCDSTEAANRYADASLDFVFIDADHEPGSVYSDLKAWWPKVKRGGVLAGHDYDEHGPREGVATFTRERVVDVKECGRCFVIEK
jgi:hypothetical protein